MKAGVAGPRASDLLFATSKSRHAVGPGVVVTVSPKHPLSLGSVYEPPGPGATDRRPRFHTTRGLYAEIGKHPRFARTGDQVLAGSLLTTASKQEPATGST